jgi:proteasome component ECM29
METNHGWVHGWEGRRAPWLADLFVSFSISQRVCARAALSLCRPVYCHHDKPTMDPSQLEDVLFRLSMTKDESFGGVIYKLLPRLLLVLTPENWGNVQVRTKVVQIFSHINKRIKALPSVTLPCQEILNVVIGSVLAPGRKEQAMGDVEEEEDDEEEDDERRRARKHLPPSNPVKTNFGMVYLTMGVPRMSPTEQAALLPSLIDGISLTSIDSQKYSILRLLLDVIPNIPIPTVIEHRREAMSFLNDAPEKDRLKILDFWFDVLLYKRPPLLSHSAAQTANNLLRGPGAPMPTAAAFAPGQTVYYKPTGEPAVVLSVHPHPTAGQPPYYKVLMPNSSEKQTTRSKLSDTYMPPGLSPAAKANILGPSKTEIPQQKLNEYKIGIMKILGSNVFPDEWVLRHTLAARADSSHIVIELGDDMHRRMSQDRPELENIPLVTLLLRMCIGDLPQAKSSPNLVRTPAGQTMKLKILEDLLRSRVCASQSTLCVKVIYDCLYGTGSTAKHKLGGVRLCKWCFETASDESLDAIAPLLSQGIQKMLFALLESGRDADSRKLREYCYSCLSVLAPKKPTLFSGNLDLPRMCFEGLLENDNEFRASAQEALSGLADAYIHSPPEIQTELMDMLLKYAESPEYRARLCSVQVATRVFPADHVPTRYLCMLLSADTRPEVRSVACRGLEVMGRAKQKAGGLDGAKGTRLIADFVSMVMYLDEGSRLKQLRALEMASCFKYLGAAFEHSQADAKTAAVTPLNEQAVNTYAKALNFGLEADPAAAGASTLFYRATCCVGDLAKIVPDIVGPSFSDEKSITRLKSWLSNTNEDLRTAASRVLKYTVNYIPDEALLTLVDYLLERAEDTASSKVTAKHGSLSALGSIVVGTLEGKCPRERIVECLLKELSMGHAGAGDMKTEAVSVAKGNDKAAKNPATKKRAQSPLVVYIAASDAIGMVGKAGRMTEEEGVAAVVALIKLSKTKVEDANKLIEHAVVAIGDVCEGSSSKSEECGARRKAMDGMFSMTQVKYEEIQFAVGETLARIGLADLAENRSEKTATSSEGTPIETEARDTKSDGSGDDGASHAPMSLMVSILEKILETIKDARPVVRAAASIWLLSYVKFGGSKDCIVLRKRLWDLQAAFTLLLGERSQFLQELGGKGLSLIYDLADENQKKSLLSALTRSFSTGKRQQVDGATVDIYGEGGPAGAALSAAGSQSYKQMCEAATDMGNPGLIYKFLSLSSEHAQWNSRRGASFGIAEVAGEAGMEAMREQLGTIVPRLYRSRFSPDSKTRLAMHRLWESLVGKDEKTIIEKYFSDIVTVTLPALANQQWREREAACEALNDLLSIGRKAQEVLPFLDRLWESSMLVADDIKETVQLAAVKLVKSLGKLTVRLCDPKQTLKSLAEKCFGSLLPFFVEKGVVDPCKTTRALSMHFLIKIVRGAGDLLTNHVPVVAPMLLEYLSAMESQDLVYLQFHTDKMNITAERLEELRLQVAQSGPFAEALQLCLQYVSKKGVEDLVPSLAQLIRSGTGLATRTGTADFITNLAVQEPKLFKPFASPLLNPLAGGLNDRSVNVRRSYSRAIAQIAKLSKVSAVRKLLVRITDQYKTADPSDSGDSVRHTSGMVLLALANAAPKKLEKRMGELVPLVFMAKFNKNEQVKRTWSEVWETITSTTAAGVREHIDAITTLMLECLDASAYEMRRQGADALTEAIGVAGDTANSQLPRIVEALTKSMSGRYWGGKESVLRSVVAVVKASGSEAAAEHSDQLIDLMVRECERKSVDDAYIRDCVDSLGKLIEALPDREYYLRISSSIFAIEERSRKDDPVLRARAIECLGRSWPAQGNAELVSVQKDTIHSLMGLLGDIMQAAVWRVRLAILSALTMIFKKVGKDVADDALMGTAVDILKAGAGDIKYHQVRSEVARAVLAIAKRVEDGPENHNAAESKAIFENCSNAVRDIARGLCNDTDPTTQQKSQLARDSFGKTYGV